MVTPKDTPETPRPTHPKGQLPIPEGQAGKRAAYLHDTLKLSDLKDGSLVCYQGEPFFISDGLDGRILTDKRGMWYFLEDLDWDNFSVLYWAT